MANIAYIDTTPSTWNRGPNHVRARRLDQLRQRRKNIIGQAGRLLARRTVGGDDRVLRHLEKLSALHEEYCRADCEIIAIELL